MISVLGLILLDLWLSVLIFLVVCDGGRVPMIWMFGGVSYLELLILYERWAGERLVLEKLLPKSSRAGRPISVSAVPLGPGIDLWRSCRFIGRIFWFLDRLSL